jgi:uncharacterized membrane protein YdjX (TVP38/TMEM64 family)
MEILKDREAIIELVNSYGALGPLVLALAIVLQVVVAAIPGHLLMFACGYLYGFPMGFLLTWVTTVIASQATFYLARRAGKPLVYRLASKELIEKWNRIAEKQGVVFYIFSFSLPIFPADIMSYVAGFTSISARRYLVANLIGHLPVAILMNLAGAYGFELSTGSAITIAVVGIASFVLWLRYQNKVEEKLNIDQGGA